MALLMGFGAEKIRWPVLEALGQLSEGEAKDLITNAMCVPHVGFVLVACLLNIPGLFAGPRASDETEGTLAGPMQPGAGAARKSK